MKFLLVFLGLMTAHTSYAAVASQSAAEYCVDRRDENFMQDLAKNSQNHLAFRNSGGLLNGGVCWWHSRFTRNALYLAIYRPDLPRPNGDQMASIIRDIRNGRTVVTISSPGHHLRLTH